VFTNAAGSTTNCGYCDHDTTTHDTTENPADTTRADDATDVETTADDDDDVHNPNAANMYSCMMAVSVVAALWTCM
jgi:hypothetical protein